MNWNTDGGRPTQLEENGILLSKASLIAAVMKYFFIEKNISIRENIESIQNNFKNAIKSWILRDVSETRIMFS